jgi:hypothetical protein
MYARWLVGAESLAVAIVLYCARIADSSEFKGVFYGFDGPPDSELRIIWRLRAREALLLLIVLWVAAVLLAYAKSRADNIDYAAAKYGSSVAIKATVVIPLACVLIGWVLGMHLALGL